MDRRDLFSFGKRFINKEEAKPFVVLPPYLSDILKLEQCVSCEEKSCVNVCETNILKLDEVGKPFVDFLEGGCTYCEECMKSCKYEVLCDSSVKIDASFEIDILSCLAWNNTMCYSCKDPCIDNAIKFIGLFRPNIETELCTNCGFCVRVCPANAIKIKPK